MRNGRRTTMRKKLRFLAKICFSYHSVYIYGERAERKRQCEQCDGWFWCAVVAVGILLLCVYGIYYISCTGSQLKGGLKCPGIQLRYEVDYHLNRNKRVSCYDNNASIYTGQVMHLIFLNTLRIRRT